MIERLGGFYVTSWGKHSEPTQCVETFTDSEARRKASLLLREWLRAKSGRIDVLVRGEQFQLTRDDSAIFRITLGL